MARMGLDPRVVRILWTVLVFAGAVALAWVLRQVLLLFAFAVFFAYLIFPLIRFVERRVGLRGRRTASTAVVYLALLVALGVLGAAVGPRLAREASLLAGKIPEMSKQVQSGQIVTGMLAQRGWEDERVREVERYISDHANQIIAYGQAAATAVLKELTGAWVVILVPIFAFFFLKDAEAFVTGIESLFESGAGRGLWRGVANDVHRLLGEYVRALVLLSLITVVVWTILFLAAGVPYPFALAAVGGALEFIPVLGPAAAGVIVMGVSLFTGFPHPWLLLAFILLWRGIQDYVSSPLVMGSGIELHPALVIVGVVAGGEIGGPVGMFLSVPVIAALRIVWRRVRALERDHGPRTVLVPGAEPEPEESVRPARRA
jgi:predicted PurR-regulated permease PerM